MRLFESELKVIEAANIAAASLGDDPNHTVSAAAMDIHGNIYTGVNVYHFTGGPCAEQVVLGVAAAAKSDPLMTIAAVSSRGQRIIPPCGRCRQVLLDLQPDVHVAVPGDSGPVMVSIRDLLPNQYMYQDDCVNRFVRFDKRYYDEVRLGLKRTTVRWRDPVTVGPKTFVFEDHPGHPVLTGEVIRLEQFSLDCLTAEQANVKHDTDMDEYRAGLHQRYPDMPANAVVDVVKFDVFTD